MIPEAAQRAAEAAYTEKLVELRLAEGGGFKVASQQRRAIAFALEAAAPHMLQHFANRVDWRCSDCEDPIDPDKALKALRDADK